MPLATTGWALVTAVGALATTAILAPPAGALPTTPSLPDLRGFTTVPALTDDSGTYFHTADGLHCKMKDEHVDCVGTLPATGVDANAISIGSSVSAAGPGYGGIIAGVRLITDAEASTINKFGDAAPLLHPGEKVVGAGSECAVANPDRIMCTVGHPVREWLVVSQAGTGIGPATSGLPAGYPEPVTFVQGHVNSANVRFPSNFTVDGPDGELRCQMGFSSVVPPLGCDGDLPGTDANEVFFDEGGAVKVVHTDAPRFDGPSAVTPPRLPVGYRTPYPGACLAITGGVACYRGGSNGSPLHGFRVDAAGVTTF